MTSNGPAEENASFIVNARTDIPFLLAEIARLQGLISVKPPESEFNEIPEHGWVCYHCGEHFMPTYGGQRAAGHHFGRQPDAQPACKIAAEDKGLVRRIRVQEDMLKAAEAEVARLHAERAEAAKIMREVADALDERYDDFGNCFSCHSPCVPDPENYDDLDPIDTDHYNGCLVTRLRTAADKAEGK